MNHYFKIIITGPAELRALRHCMEEVKDYAPAIIVKSRTINKAITKTRLLTLQYANAETLYYIGRCMGMYAYAK